MITFEDLILRIRDGDMRGDQLFEVIADILHLCAEEWRINGYVVIDHRVSEIMIGTLSSLLEIDEKKIPKIISLVHTISAKKKEGNLSRSGDIP